MWFGHRRHRRVDGGWGGPILAALLFFGSLSLRTFADIDHIDVRPVDPNDPNGLQYRDPVFKPKFDQNGRRIRNGEMPPALGLLFLGAIGVAGLAMSPVGTFALRLILGKNDDDDDLVPSGIVDEKRTGMRITASALHGGVEGGGRLQRAVPVERASHQSPESLSDRDPGFSRPQALEQFARMHDATWRTVGRGPIDRDPYLRNGHLQLGRRFEGIDIIDAVVHGEIDWDRVTAHGDWDLAPVTFRSLIHERRGILERWTLAEESWIFRRHRSVTTLPPELEMSRPCPRCGAGPLQTDADGRCQACQAPIRQETLPWHVMSAELVRERAPSEWQPTLGLDHSAAEQPHRPDANVGSGLRALLGAHPEFSQADLEQAVQDIAAAWMRSYQTKDSAPLESLALPVARQAVEFEILRHDIAGMTLHREDVRIDKIQLVRVDRDGWYEEITIRLWWSLRSWVDREGKILLGKEDEAVKHSNLWTLVHPSGQKITSRGWKLAESAVIPS